MGINSKFKLKAEGGMIVPPIYVIILEKADLFLAKAVAVAMPVKHRKLSNRPAIPLSA